MRYLADYLLDHSLLRHSGDAVAQRGHAEDCPACTFVALPGEDREILDATAFHHRRKDPPAQPFRPGRSMTAWMITLVFWALYLFGLLVDHPLVSVPLLVVTAAALARVFRLHSTHSDGSGASWCPMCKEHRYRQFLVTHAQWRRAIDFWFAEQRGVRRELHSGGLLWPCPTCGALSCPDQHSVTTTYAAGGGLVSYTNPR